MGPRPCGRGRLHELPHDERARDWLQWGHGLAAVDGRARAARPRPRPGFNGATALRPWTVVHFLQHAGDNHASMGPRPCGRGRPAACGRQAAIGPLQWGHGLAAVDGPACTAPTRSATSFNGATALRPWTAAPLAGFVVAVVVLQWGHGLAAVDGGGRCRLRRRRRCFNGATALRPWTAVVALGASHLVAGFNGATALRPWTVCLV